MGKIKILDESVSSRIAAGEVIERPASVIRELIDNSIDANSKNIIIKTYNAGIDKIIVWDDGDGIEKDDILIAIEKHSTSKINSISDLSNLKTMGFRGEALHSIQTISKLTITSNTDNSGLNPGYKISNFGSHKFEIIDFPFNKGTKVEVLDLFYNLPARKKFLKSKITEFNNCKKVIIDKCFSKRDIIFKYFNDDKKIFETKGDNDFTHLFFDIYDENKFEIFNVKEEFNNIKIELFYSETNIFFPTRKYQFLFVNSRPVYTNFFYSAIDAGIRDYISTGRYPLMYVYLTINPDLIDINIHPAKKEIKFYNQQEIFNLIVNTIKKSMSLNNKNNFIITEPFFEKKDIKYDFNINKQSSTNFFNQEFNEINFQKKLSINQNELLTSKNNIDYNIIGVIFDTYILVEYNDEILFIDFHAASETIIYNKKKELYKKQNNIEVLIIPIILEINNWDSETEKRINLLNSNGFLIEHYEANSVIIREVPEILLIKKSYDNAIDIIEKFLEDKNSIDINIIDYILIEASCKEAIKKGYKLSLNEIGEITNLFFENNLTNCPHGRPIFFKLSKNNIEKYFQRKK